MRILIAGCGTYGEVYLSYLRRCTDFEIVGFLDDDPEAIGKTVQGLRVLGTTEDLALYKEQGVEGIIAPIGNNKARVRILEQATAIGMSTPNFIHPTASVSKDAQIGKGVYILPESIVMPYADIRDFVMVSMGVHIAHHTILHKGVFLSSGANMGAGIEVGECAYFGMSATIMTGIKMVGKDVTVGAGAVVIRDVPEGITVAGVPAKPLEKRKS
jgi:sugar O-acyltransferase (sialic acid O-acetyltransferase NeuD family)